MEEQESGLAPQWTAYVYWKNGDRERTYEEISGYSVSDGCLFLSLDWTPGKKLIHGIPLSNVQSYELFLETEQ